MRRITLNTREQFVYETIKSLVDHKGNVKRTAVILGISVRHVYRLIHILKTAGKAGFIHGNKNRKPAITYPDSVRNQIIELYRSEYSDTNFTQFSEFVYEDMGIKITPRTISNWLEKENILSPRAHRSTRKQMKKKIEADQKEKDSDLDNLSPEPSVNLPIELDRRHSFPRKERAKYAGEVIQMDACQTDWFNNGVQDHLHVAIDDATGMLTGLYLDPEETLNGYYHLLKQTLDSHGIPARFLTDKRTVFEYKRKDCQDLSEDPVTQFTKACSILGTEVRTTSIPQGKGRVERVNQTLQDRLPKEFRRHQIKTVEQANEFLSLYKEKFNAQYALQLPKAQSVFEAAPDNETINQILSVRTTRVIDQGHCIKFKNHYYIPVNGLGEDVWLKPKTKVEILTAFDGQQMLCAGDAYYCLRRIEDHAAWSEQFDPKPVEKKKPRTPWIPPKNHPWRKGFY